MGNLKVSLETLQKTARERTVKTQNIEYDIETLVKKIRTGVIKLDPDYQRRHRWTIETSSRLIESLILNIPIPTIFISQDVDVDLEVDEEVARYTVIDGQQRLTAISDFMSNRYSLVGLKVLSDLNGAEYKDLPSFLTRRLEERTVKCLRIDSTVDEQVKYDIFERLNTGSVRLESQELRNATIRGPFNNLIKDIAQHKDFRALIQVPEDDPLTSTKVQKMEDVELVLRYFALRQGGYRDLKKGFREFLTERMISFNQLSDETLSEFRTDFFTLFGFIHKTCGASAFAKFRFEDDKKIKMSNFNAAVFDALTVGISDLFPRNDIILDPDKVATKLYGYDQLFKDALFFSSVSGSVNDAQKVVNRIDLLKRYLSR